MRLMDVEAPQEVRSLGHRCAVRDDGTVREVWLNYALFLRYPKEDVVTQRFAVASLAQLGVATKTQIAEAFDCHRNSVGRMAAALEGKGLQALLTAKPGPRGPWKLDGALRDRVWQLYQRGLKVSAIIARLRRERGTRVSCRSVERIVRERTAEGEGAARQPSLAEARPVALPLFRVVPETPTVAEAEATAPPAGVLEAPSVPPSANGAWGEPAEQELPRVVVQEGPVVHAGAFLLYPALAAMGLVEAFQKVYRPLAGRRYGLRELVLSLFFLWVLGYPSVEAFKGARRRDVGALIGARLAPSVKTLRRKLGELATLRQGHRVVLEMARRCVDRDIVQVGVLYVDGHLKPYYGRRSVGEVWSPQRRMPVPGLAQYFVNDVQGRPLFFLTAQPHRSLTQMLPKLVEEIRALIGERPFTLVFDRGGYSLRLFRDLRGQGVHLLTYRRKPFAPYPQEAFQPQACEFKGRRREFRLHEDTVDLGEAGLLRVIALQRDDGRQTHILTTDRETGAARLACLMINRWGQENFFKYMLQHYALDALHGYGADGVIEEAQVPNPRWRELDREVRDLKERIRGIKEQMGTLAAQRANRKGLRPLRRELQGLEQTLATRKRERAVAPKQVPVRQTERRLDRLDLEKKVLADTIKVAAYNAEAWLLERLERHYQDPRDGREVLRSLLHLKGRLRLEGTDLVVHLAPPEVPRYRRALAGLCADLNGQAPIFPGTTYRLRFTLAGTSMHHQPSHLVGAMS
jgi:transposase